MHILRRGSLGSSPFLFLSLARVHLLYVTNAGEFGIRLGRSEPQAGANPALLTRQLLGLL